MNERQILRVVVRSFLSIVLISAIAWFGWTVRSVLILVLLAAVLATGLSPIVDALAGVHPQRHRFRMSRGIATLLLYLVIIAGALILVVEIIPALFRQLRAFLGALPNYYTQLIANLHDLGESYPYLAGLDVQLQQQTADLVPGIGGVFDRAGTLVKFVVSVFSGILSLIFVLALTYYLIQEGDRVRSWLIKLLPTENRPMAAVVAQGAQAKIGSWLIGQVALATIIGTVSFIGLTAIGVPYSLLLAVIAAIGEVIPIIGPVFAAIPAIIIASFVSPVTGLLTLGLAIMIQQLENNLIVPQLMHRAVNLSPIVILTAIMVGGEALGVVGAIIAIPVAATIAIVVDESIRLRDQEENAARRVEDQVDPIGDGQIG